MFGFVGKKKKFSSREATLSRGPIYAVYPSGAPHLRGALADAHGHYAFVWLLCKTRGRVRAVLRGYRLPGVPAFYLSRHRGSLAMALYQGLSLGWRAI